MLMIFMFMQIQYTGDMCKLLARIHFTEVPQRQCLVQVEWESFFFFQKAITEKHKDLYNIA